MRDMKTEAILAEMKKLRGIVKELSESSLNLIRISNMGERHEKAWLCAYEVNQHAHDMLKSIDRTESTVRNERYK